MTGVPLSKAESNQAKEQEGNLGATLCGRAVFLRSILNGLGLLARSSHRGVNPSVRQKGKRKVIQRSRNLNDEILSCSKEGIWFQGGEIY